MSLALGSAHPSLDVIDVADHSVRIVAKKLDSTRWLATSGIFGTATSSFKELATDLAQRIWFESRHETPLVFPGLQASL
jgi:hypothetical protein